MSRRNCARVAPPKIVTAVWMSGPQSEVVLSEWRMPTGPREFEIEYRALGLKPGNWPRVIVAGVVRFVIDGLDGSRTAMVYKASLGRKLRVTGGVS